jgi:hypothetical protein
VTLDIDTLVKILIIGIKTTVRNLIVKYLEIVQNISLKGRKVWPPLIVQVNVKNVKEQKDEFKRYV